MDPTTQSAQISSSQGLADGQNSAKESKLSDSFLSSSPVSLIQSPQDKRVVLGSDKPYEGVATSLRFPSQPGSFTPDNYGSEAGPPDGQLDSPIISPVSERIKALEALAAKKKEPDFRSDGGFSHFRDRHHEKFSTDAPKFSTDAPKFSTDAHKFSTDAPRLSSDAPRLSSDAPRLSSDAPRLSSDAPRLSSDAPRLSSDAPRLSSDAPRLSSDAPRLSSDAPRLSSDAPRLSSDAPRLSSDAPKPLSDAPKSLSDIPKSHAETPKSSTDKMTPTVQKRECSVDQESPESPFEVLGDLRQVNESEETEEWMKTHLPPVTDFDAVDLIKGMLTSENVASKEEKGTCIVIPDAPAAFAGVPAAFMDSPAEAPKLKDEFIDAQKQSSVEEESEFDLSFLPTAYMWDQQEKAGAQATSNLNSVLPASPAPPSGFDSPSPPVSPPVGTDVKHNVSDDKKTMWTGDLEPPEASEADSSGESDDTVIEDSVTLPASVLPASSDPAVSNDPIPAPANPSLTTEENEPPPPKSERKLMQVPTINVIETDEPNYSEEEMEMELEDEDYEAVKDLARGASKTPEPDNGKKEPPKTRPLETEFMEGYSPPSSPVDSDAEYSPKHNILKSLPEIVHQESASKPEAQSNQAKSEKSQTTSSKVKDEVSPFILTNEEPDFPENDDEWSNEAQEILVKPCKTGLAFMETTPYTQSKVDEKSNTAAKDAYMETTSRSKTSFMQDDIYDRQSFDYDYDASSPLDDIDDKGLDNAKQRFLSDPSQILIEPLNARSQNLDDFTSVNDDEAFPKPVGQPSLREYPQDPYSSFQSETLSGVNEQDFIQKMTTDVVTDNMANSNSLPPQKTASKIQQDTKPGHHTPNSTSNTDSIAPRSSMSEPTDSFVEFMRECLKSRQDEEPDNAHQAVSSNNKLCKTGMPPSQSPPTMVMDLEQERLTINALKELGSSQEEEVEPLQLMVPDQSKANPSVTSTKQSSFAAVPNPPCSQSNRVFDSTYSKEVEAIDEWVAEAYHLAEHVLTAILTHLSVKDLIYWRDPKKSGLVFGLSLLLLLSLAAFSFISVASYLLLALLCVTITFRIYKCVVQAVQKSSDGHPFKTLIDKDVSIPPETFRKHVDSSLTHINRALKQMSRLFLVEDLVDSLKLAVVMWLFTYVGAVFNGITILILADILLFAVPPVYEKNKSQIDQYIDVIRTQVNTTMAKLQEKLPGAVKRSKTE
ncbi:reticulon-3 isoform X1 [Anarhichas minor]|uniref:reticulon-3 isoform X1 n=1 Tax=Anarhichas minor TaxID=65739 RepID=UPI003F740921